MLRINVPRDFPSVSDHPPTRCQPGGDHPSRRFLQDFTVEGTLQRTIFGSVVLARHRHGHLRAVKVVNRRMASQYRSIRTGSLVSESAEAEVRLLRLLRDVHPHRNLLALAPQDEQYEEAGASYVTLPYAERGDLFSHVERQAGGRSDNPEQFLSRCRRVFAQLCLGLHHLHTVVGVAHNDLSLENALVFDDRITICDYGLALEIGKPWPPTRRSSGKLPYQAPEIFHGRQRVCTAKADVFSLGVLLFIAVFGTPPFKHPDRHADKRYAYIQDGRLGELLGLWGESHLAPAPLVELIASMLREDPAIRVSLDDVMRHQWTREPPSVKAVKRGSDGNQCAPAKPRTGA